MKNPTAITISRSYGSGGREIGKRIAEEFGWSYYDREILQLASDESGISEHFFARADEATRRTSLFRIASNVFDGKLIPPDRDDFTSNENLFRYQAKIIRQLAETENCVIIGRCANYILKDYSNAVRIYIHAPEDVCIRNVMRHDGLMQDEAVKRIRDIDKRRSDYYRFFTRADWKDAQYYDLCLDVSRLGPEKCIQLIRAFVDAI